MDQLRNEASTFPPQSAFLRSKLLDECFGATVECCQEECNTMLVSD
jgi:hypothetical protein